MTYTADSFYEGRLACRLIACETNQESGMSGKRTMERSGFTDDSNSWQVQFESDTGGSHVVHQRNELLAILGIARGVDP